MVPLRFKCLALCLALLPCLLALPTQEPTRGAGRGWDPEAERNRLHRDLIGFWELTHMTGDGLSYHGSDLKGYLLVSTDHIAFEYHYRQPTRLPDVDANGFQSGIHKYRFDGMGRMETLSIIGAHGSDQAEGIFREQPGRMRSFLIELEGDHLVLSHTFSRFEYTRIETLPYSDLEPGVNFDDRLPPDDEDEQ